MDIYLKYFQVTLTHM